PPGRTSARTARADRRRRPTRGAAGPRTRGGAPRTNRSRFLHHDEQVLSLLGDATGGEAVEGEVVGAGLEVGDDLAMIAGDAVGAGGPAEQVDVDIGAAVIDHQGADAARGRDLEPVVVLAPRFVLRRGAAVVDVDGAV